MFTLFSVIIFIFLVIVSFIDLKTRAIPSIFLTGMILVALAINPHNLVFGVMGIAFGLLMYEGNFFSGVGDIKISVLIGLMISTLSFFFIYVALVMVIGLVFKLFYKYRKIDEFPFFPVFLIAYFILAIMGGIA